MREKNVKEIVRYYYEIPEMVRLLKTEQRRPWEAGGGRRDTAGRARRV